MDQTQAYVVDSLELHLFFSRIMKEHALFLKVGFLPPNAGFAKQSEHFLRRFEGILSRTITLSDHVVRQCVLTSGEICTEFTEQAEQQTQRLTGTSCGKTPCISRALTQQVRRLNQDALELVEHLIAFKERLLCSVTSCKVFTANYPLLIDHILREAKLYRAHLVRLEGRDEKCCTELRDSELFWNQIMMEHALFIRGLLDPCEAQLIDTADSFASDFKRLLETSSAANDRTMCGSRSLALTEKFRDFKRAGAEGIEACKIRSLILPLLADHVLREANHYIRLMEN